jgi:hypothetical protein
MIGQHSKYLHLGTYDVNLGKLVDPFIAFTTLGAVEGDAARAALGSH